jgi:XTP/dITP diphosphohydrolase
MVNGLILIKMTLVFATNNLHKLEEVQRLVGTDFQLKSLKDIGCEADIPETGSTFRENASIKSHFIYERFKVNCFADDSGLEIEALDGAPGIYSARYSGTGSSEDNVNLILKNLHNISNRKANFRCVISLIWNGDEYFFEGSVNGKILTEPAGAAGFGYDPIFVPDGPQGSASYSQSFAEMSPEQKNQISHRGLAIAEMVKFLKNTISS